MRRHPITGRVVFHIPTALAIMLALFGLVFIARPVVTLVGVCLFVLDMNAALEISGRLILSAGFAVPCFVGCYHVLVFAEDTWTARINRDAARAMVEGRKKSSEHFMEQNR